MNYTPSQIKILDFVRDYVAEHRTSPTLNEIGQHLGVHRVTVHQHVVALIKKGAVKKAACRSRSIEILDPKFLPHQPMFEKIRAHIGHKPIVAVTYGDPGCPVNVAIECEQCGCVIVDAEHEEN